MQIKPAILCYETNWQRHLQWLGGLFKRVGELTARIAVTFYTKGALPYVRAEHHAGVK